MRKDQEVRKALKDKGIGMVKYGVPDDVLAPKETKKAGDIDRKTDPKGNAAKRVNQ